MRLHIGVGVLLTAIGCASIRSSESPRPHMHELNVIPPLLTLGVGDSATLVGYITADAGLSDRNVLWWSSDTLVATVSGAGHVFARGLGTATIVATAAADPAFKSVAVVGVLSGAHR